MIRKLWTTLGGRKFLGLVVATGLCALGRLTGAEWVAAYGIYAAANVAVDRLMAARGGGTGE